MPVCLDQHSMQHAPTLHVCQSRGNPIKLDQHFMVDEKILERIVKAAGIKKGERILEIGAGTGNLTKLLSLAGAEVIAIELDPQLATMLKERFSPGKNIEVIEGNALKLIRKLSFDKIVSNIPYAICEPLLLLLRNVHFELAVLTIPEKFVKNLASGSKLGLETGIFFHVEVLFKVPKEAFVPKPDTESVVVLLKPKKSILRLVLLSPNAKVKNAIMEALVESRKCTKNQAREAIKAMKLSNPITEKRVSGMDLNDLRQLLSKLK